MTGAFKVRKHFEVYGRDQRDLVHRIETFRQALDARSGAIVDIQWKGQGTKAEAASIVYQIPVVDAGLEMPAT